MAFAVEIRIPVPGPSTGGAISYVEVPQHAGLIFQAVSSADLPHIYIAHVWN